MCHQIANYLPWAESELFWYLKVQIKVSSYKFFYSCRKCQVVFYVTILIDFSDDEGDGSDKKANEEPEEFGKFLHLKERVGMTDSLH